ncbi:MAG TPA: primase-helicase family protein [Buttiauxella sp.]|nr:primase-helicase family protein [Buttiauxella sp.]
MNPKHKIEKLIDHLQKQKYAFISAQGKILLHHIPTNTNHSLDILEREYYLSTGEQWRRSYLNLLWDHIPFIKVHDFNPAKPYGIDQNGTLNMFRRWHSDKPPATDLTLWHEYLARLFPDQTDRDTVSAYMAHMFQHPEQRPSWHIVIPSDTGTGKGFMFNQILSPLLMHQTTLYSNYSTLTSVHNDAMARTILILFDDPPPASRSMADRLKSIQTEPVIEINRKYEQPRKVSTYTRFFTFSNSESPIEVEANDRRHYCTHYVRHKVSREETAEFITCLAEWLAVGGLEAIHTWLMAYPLESFTPYRPPFSVALERMKQASISEEQNEAEIFTGENPAFAFQAFHDACPSFPRPQDASQWLRDNGYISDRVRTRAGLKSVWYRAPQDGSSKIPESVLSWFVDKYYPTQ